MMHVFQLGNVMIMKQHKCPTSEGAIYKVVSEVTTEYCVYNYMLQTAPDP